MGARIQTTARRSLAIVTLLAGVAVCQAQAINFDVLRNQMVDREIVGAGIRDPRVVKSMRDTPRHEFVEASARPNAYYDMALPIGSAQTISPPFIVAYMTEHLEPKATDKVLEIGTGSGYQAAILSPLVKEVYSIEIVKALGEKAERTLKRLTTEKKANYKNVFVKVGDGYQGWPEHAPFDKIIVTCSPEDVPRKLVEQLAEGGRMLVPVGERYQQTLYAFEKHNGELTKAPLLPMMFVPMTGEAEANRVVKPDPLHPEINNGGFEDLTADVERPGESAPQVWYYQRQLKLSAGPGTPEGKHYAAFTNSTAGLPAHALQGLAVDGSKVKELVFKLWVKASNVRPGLNSNEQAGIAITFFDTNRKTVGYTMVGPWTGTFAWQSVTESVKVPPSAREAIIRVGLSGTTGEIDFDDIRISGR